MTRRLIDLSHPITAGMVTYPGIPGPRYGVHLSFDESHGHYAPGTEFFMGSVELVGNTGAYLDSPAHRFRGAADIAGLALESFADLPGVVVDARSDPGDPGGRAGAAPLRGIGPAELRAALDAAVAEGGLRGTAVLIRTGHSRHWGSERYYHDHPYLTATAAQWLVDARVALVGIDSLNIDGTDTGERPAHTALLRAGIPVVEHLTGLAELPTSGFRFTAAPAPFVGMSTMPVRAFAVVQS